MHSDSDESQEEHLVKKKSEEEILSDSVFGETVESIELSDDEESSKQPSESQDIVQPTQINSEEKPVEQLTLIEIVDCDDCLAEELE